MIARVYALYDRCAYFVPHGFPGLTRSRWKVRLFLQPNPVQTDPSKVLLYILYFLFAIQIIAIEIIWGLHYHYALSCTSYGGTPGLLLMDLHL
jgi:hypothetical protein